MNNIFLHPTKTPSTRQMPPYQQPTYRNTSNIFTNVLSPQPPEHGSKLLKRATSKHGPVSPSRLSNDTYQNQKPQHLDIWTNKEKTFNQRNKARMTKTQWTPEHGSKLLKRATSKHGPVSLSRLSNDTYQNQKPQHLDIWTNKEETYNQ